jgi:hypothetical protein
MIRVTTDFWVSALLRRAFAAGGFAVVLRHGSPEAGAVFVVTRGRMGDLALYAPAPQSSYGEGKPADRMFQRQANVVDQDTLEARIARETRFDPDLWLVEIEADDAFVAEALSLAKP